MKNKIKCYDVASMAIGAAEEQFETGFKRDTERFSVFKHFCAALDDISERFNGVAFETEVDKRTKDINISLVCSYFEVESDDEFYELLESAKSFSMKASKEGEDLIQLDFVIGGVWTIPE